MSVSQILKQIEEEASLYSLPIIGREKGTVLRDLIMKYQPKSILEVGSLVGYSSVLMSQFLPSVGVITTIEIDEEVAKVARSNFLKAGLENKVNLIVGDALEEIPKLSGVFDMLFLDASKNEYIDYLKLAEPKLSPDSIVVADNVKIFSREMSDYLEYVRNFGSYYSQTLDFTADAVEVSLRTHNFFSQ